MGWINEIKNTKQSRDTTTLREQSGKIKKLMCAYITNKRHQINFPTVHAPGTVSLGYITNRAELN